MRISSDIMYLPLGRRSASTGTRAPMRVKSSSSSGTFAACAIASRCSTALVEPLSAMTTVIAFSNASRVRICDGVMPAFTSLTTALPASSQSLILWRDTASCAELFGRLMPSASIAEAMVLAVYMPAQLPGPGIAVRSISFISRAEIAPARKRAARLEHGDDVAMLRTGPDRAAIDEHRRPIEPRERDQAAGHVLVAAADRHDAIEALRARDGLDRVRNHFARHERVAHAGRAVRDAVRDRDRAERRALAAGLVDRLLPLRAPGGRCACCTA